ncbi:serine hydrolase domain-containing protein [Shinella sp. S4-D37]|uniref:serine hydrolase domain-containing protein n=1 Tax=Shinella sp. S4-D37 TaxID=3161999 RepID=UPI0034660298
MTVKIEGHCDAAFLAVRDAFAANFEVDREIGASCSVVIDGRTIVDIWGGYTDDSRTTPWSQDTIVNLMSVAKGFDSIVMQKLFDRGLLEIDAPVAKYWPEFAQAGKSGVTVRHVLSHTSGLEVVREPMWPGAIYDWNAFVGALERQAPSHEPGTFRAYHPMTVGHLTGELVRRVTGKSYGRILRETIGAPFGIDFQVGLSRPELARCARFTPGPGYDDPQYAPSPLNDLLVASRAQFDAERDDAFNSEQYRMSEIPSANGHGNGRSIAKFYGKLALNDEAIVTKEALQRICEVQWEGVEAVLSHDIRMGLGVRRNCVDVYMGPNETAWGHSGAGGSLGYVDPEAKLGFGYAMNLMRPTRNNGPRPRRLIDALYSCL